jgi:hypothetical protein
MYISRPIGRRAVRPAKSEASSAIRIRSVFWNCVVSSRTWDPNGGSKDCLGAASARLLTWGSCAISTGKDLDSVSLFSGVPARKRRSRDVSAEPHVSRQRLYQGYIHKLWVGEVAVDPSLLTFPIFEQEG